MRNAEIASWSFRSSGRTLRNDPGRLCAVIARRHRQATDPTLRHREESAEGGRRGDLRFSFQQLPNSRPGMKFLVDGAKSARVGVGVYLRRRDTRVAEHLLYRSEVGAALQHVRCEGMAKRVGRNGTSNTSQRCISLDPAPHVLPIHAPAVTRYEKVTAVAALR